MENRSYGFSQTPFNECSDGSLLITQQFDNTVYSLTKDSFTPGYVFNFNTLDQIPENQKELDYDQLSKSLSDKNVVKRIFAVDKKDNMLYIMYSAYFPGLAMRRSIAAIDLTNKDVKRVRLGDEFDPLFPFTSNMLSFSDGSAICYYPAVSVMNVAKMYSLDISDYNLTENDNPVIFKYKLKN